MSALKLMADSTDRGWMLDFYFNRDSSISRARNSCVDYFRKTDCTHLFFIDADIGFEPDQFYRVLHSGYEVATGVYPLKNDNAGFPLDFKSLGAEGGDGFAEAREATTGFMCIERKALDRIDHPFDDLRLPDDFLTEDYAFCHRHRALGGKVMVDMHSKLTHQGTKLYVRDLRSHAAAAVS